MDKKENSKLPSNNSGLAKAARFTGIGLQLGITIYLGSVLGEWLDRKYSDGNVNWTTICTLLGVFAGLTSTIIQVVRVTNKDEE